MIEQKRQHVANLMDTEQCSEADLELLVNDVEMRTIWSRFHLVSDLMHEDVPPAIDPDLDKRIFAAVLNEPALLVPSARRKAKLRPSFVPAFVTSNVRNWTEQATGFAIAASVTAVMVFGVQMLNSPTAPERGKSAITSLQFLEVDDLQITKQDDNSPIQELLLEETRLSSRYGLRDISPYVSAVNHSVTIPLTPIKSNFDSILEETDTVDKKSIKENTDSDN